MNLETICKMACVYKTATFGFPLQEIKDLEDDDFDTLMPHLALLLANRALLNNVLGLVAVTPRPVSAIAQETFQRVNSNLPLDIIQLRVPPLQFTNQCLEVDQHGA